MQYVLESDDFKSAYTNCLNKQEIDFYIQLRDVVAIKNWLKAQRFCDLESFNIKQLREIGKRLKIRKYNLIPKNRLIAEIYNVSGRNSQPA